MSTETSTPDVTPDARANAAPPADATTVDPPGPGDEFPFESPEFGVGGFLPHLDPLDPTDGGETR
ncbi:MAG: hypothetical protein WCA30_00165 [Dermatophilaceae bacterium]